MSDPFDPEAWPRSSGQASSRGDNDPASTSRKDDDDYDSSTFGSDAPSSSPTDNPWGDDSSDDYGTTYPSSYETNKNDADYGEYGDYDYEEVSTTPPTRGRFDDDDDDDFDDGFGTYEDDYDPFEDEFDREPDDEGGRGKRLILIGAGVVLAAVIGGLGLNALSGGGNNSANQPTTTVSNPDTTENTQPTDTTPSNTTVPPATEQALPSDVKQSLDAALTAWGQFAVSGDINVVKDHFVANGPQFQRFELDAQNISARPPGGQPMTVTLQDHRSFINTSDDWTVIGNVVWSRPGERTQTFRWEIRIVRQSDRQPWQIQTVRQP